MKNLIGSATATDHFVKYTRQKKQLNNSVLCTSEGKKQKKRASANISYFIFIYISGHDHLHFELLRTKPGVKTYVYKSKN